MTNDHGYHTIDYRRMRRIRGRMLSEMLPFLKLRVDPDHRHPVETDVNQLKSFRTMVALNTFCIGLVFYCFTSIFVLSGAIFGHDYLRPPQHGVAAQADLVDAFANWDGKWYRQILEDGYSYKPGSTSSIAFFPTYPILARWLASCTGLSSNVALLVISNSCLIGAFVVLGAYVRVRCEAMGSQFRSLTLLVMGLWPMTLFFRMAYSESAFLFVGILVFYGIERKWPPWALAAVIGMGTAIRPVGVALLPPLAIHLWNSYLGRGKLLRIAGFLIFATWGLIAFSSYQWFDFGDPLAFAKTQENWRSRPPDSSLEKLVSVLTLEPLWSVFDSSSPCFWEKQNENKNWLFSIDLANRFYFLLTVGMILLGAKRRWLNNNEIILAAGLLIIPYITRSHEMCSASLGRFEAVVFPQYLVISHLLIRLPEPLRWVFAACGGFFLGCYSALFAAGYRVF